MNLMDQVFRSFLNQFVIVFIDVILIYSANHEAHIEYLRVVLETLRNHHLFGKLSKYAFWLEEVTFLGHVIYVQ